MFQWSKELSVTDPKLDEQHQVLLALMQNILDQRTASVDVLLKHLNELIQKTQEHFFFEEDVMAAMSYEGLAEHQRIHRNLLKKLQGFSTDLQENDSQDLRAHIIIFLEAWLIGHIKQIDKKYAKLLG